MTKKPTNLLPLDGNDPAARLRFIETYGADAYNVALRQWMDRNTMSTVNGYPIRRIVSERFGGVFMVDGTKHAFASLHAAEAFARKLPTRH